jgi:hypothetical protein
MLAIIFVSYVTFAIGRSFESPQRKAFLMLSMFQAVIDILPLNPEYNCSR